MRTYGLSLDRQGAADDEAGSRNGPPLTVEEILAWADAHKARTGHWPSSGSGAIPETRSETWAKVHIALKEGHRGLPGGDTLARLLCRSRPDRQAASSGLRAWMPGEDHLVRTLPPAEVARRTSRCLLEVYVRRYELGRPDFDFDSPRCVVAPRPGCQAPRPQPRPARGTAARQAKKPEALPATPTLFGVMEAKRHKRTTLEVEQILAWADAHYARTGRWPSQYAGPMADAPGENWEAIDHALRDGHRGLPGGDSLSRLLARHRGKSRWSR
jgi:hypothetical protein